MKTMKYISQILCVILLCIVFSCRKTFLDIKPNASLVVPSTLDDFQAILDNIQYMNGSTTGTLGTVGNFGGPNPMLLEVATDNYYIPENLFISFVPHDKNVYTWDKGDPYGGENSLMDWSFPYRAVFYSNIVLDGLKDLPKTSANESDWNRIKGSALFYRSHSFYQLAQVYAPIYEIEKAKELLGIPLKLTSDISDRTVRPNLESTYRQIINDLIEASQLLPLEAKYKTRPSSPATFAMLARVYLSMSDYENAKINAKKSLENFSKPLLELNTLNTVSTYPIPRFNNEVLFSAIVNSAPSNALWGVTTSRIDSSLYKSYALNDLRKDLYFRIRETNAYSFRGSYDGTGSLFFGIALDEVYLILAESLVRQKDVVGGIQYLNDLLKTRYKIVNGITTFVPYTLTDENDALFLVLEERRKELLMRGLRLTDLKRLNKDSRLAKTLVRKVNGQIYELPPNDPRYTWPIPNDVIALTGIQQNLR